MPVHDLSRSDPSAYRLLVEANGTPFAPCERTKPVVDVIAGRKTHYDLEPEDWIAALEAVDGTVAIYLYLEGDHEWWIAYDADPDEGEYDDEHGLDGPYHTWTTFPTGSWDHSVQMRGILQHHVEEIYMEGYPDESCSIYRSKIVPIRDAPEFVQEELGGEDRV
jgi:hypothetical protein